MKVNKKPIKVLIELPNWLGDCVMSTPAIENIVKYFIDIEITIIGTNSSIELLKNHPKVVKVVEVDLKNKFTIKPFLGLGFFDIYFTFRGSFRAKIIKLIVNAKNKFQFNQNKFKNFHQVEKYVEFVNNCLKTKFDAGNLICHLKTVKKIEGSRTLGINPGASYGSAKRWYPEKFAKIAIELSDNFDIIIFGGISELKFAQNIEKYLIQKKIKNFVNLAGKTSVTELTSQISNLDIFLTGDSGPMHIAASLQIPTIALFGPTNVSETSQWKNQFGFIVKKDLNCQPCMKRICPLNHHNCMKLIDENEVIDKISKVAKIKKI